ncbi:GNAT family N-acetyltransferase [Actinocorallia aurantiaca]|uniref:GNAT family N-acetyltransferase n=1 Tax=Actinocorallia aurantiaca TaxID=46204 RepID=A0ABN3UMR5_9ACTN
MIEVRTCDWSDPDGARLRAAMAVEIDERYADRDAKASPALIEALALDPGEVVFVAVATRDGVPAGHAALRRCGPDLELKRMYVTPEARGGGVSRALLDWVEQTAREDGALRVVLQTGDRQPDAVRLYEREGYVRIPVYPPYVGVPELHSICMAKTL